MALAAGLIFCFVLTTYHQADAKVVASPFGIDSPKLESHRQAGSDFKMVSVNFVNTTPQDASYVVFLEVRNKNDITEFLEFHTGVIGAFDRLNLASSWLAPEDLTRYELRAFVISNFTRPMLLTELTTTDLALELIALN